MQAHLSINMVIYALNINKRIHSFPFVSTWLLYCKWIMILLLKGQYSIGKEMVFETLYQVGIILFVMKCYIHVIQTGHNSNQGDLILSLDDHSWIERIRMLGMHNKILSVCIQHLTEEQMKKSFHKNLYHIVHNMNFNLNCKDSWNHHIICQVQIVSCDIQ